MVDSTGSASPSRRRYPDALNEWASAFAAIAAFSSGVTHTLIGVDSLRVFPFLASIRGGSRFPSVSKDNGVERRHTKPSSLMCAVCSPKRSQASPARQKNEKSSFGIQHQIK